MRDREEREEAGRKQIILVEKRNEKEEENF